MTPLRLFFLLPLPRELVPVPGALDLGDLLLLTSHLS